MQKKNNVILTGGHAGTTAISVVNEIKKKDLGFKLFWIGQRSAVEGQNIPTLASKIMPQMGVGFIPITTGRLQRNFTIWTIPSLLKIPVGVVTAFEQLIKIKPKIVISFGGFTSVPICIAAWILRIPIIIHEQTTGLGLANKICVPFANKVLIAREESKQILHGYSRKTILVGNPISEEIAKIKPKENLSKIPLIYITGGSSGAQKINNVINECLYELLKKYKVIHQTGKLDYDDIAKRREEFPSDLKSRYEVYDFIDPKKIPEIFNKADILISRAGANTVSEILVSKRPSILIPIPWASGDEQTKNAKMVEGAGFGVILPEKDLNATNLLEKLDYINKNYIKMVKNCSDEIANLDKNAARRFIDEVELSLTR